MPQVLPPLRLRQLEAFRRRMIAPNSLLEFDAADVGRHRAALVAIEPAIGAPSQRIGHRVGVVHAEPGQQDLGIAIRHIVAIAVGMRTTGRAI